MAYPGNYGYIPETLAGDGDPLDILLISDYALHPLTIVNVKIIGVLMTEDEKGSDEKIISVPSEKVDPNYKKINNYTDLPTYTLSKIKHFFKHYKDTEKNKWVKVGDFKDKDEALKIYYDSLKN